jgi:hypothetical protein
MIKLLRAELGEKEPFFTKYDYAILRSDQAEEV